MTQRKFPMKICFFLFFALVTNTVSATGWTEEIRWDWTTKNLDEYTFWNSLKFPSNFKWGTATKAYQIEGAKTYNNQYIANSILYRNDGYKNNNGFGHWDRYKADVQLMKKAGLTEYRFSIAWEKVETQRGKLDFNALAHYIDLCKELRKNGIEPVVCLFHFALPIWFYEQGGFEKQENMEQFVRFATLIANELKPYVSRWMTYNEPIAYVMEAYNTGRYPPYKKGFMHLRTAGVVLRNMLNAHVAIHSALKEINSDNQIGFVHMFHLLDSYHNNYMEHSIIKAANQLMHDTIFDFFKTGTFNWLYIVHDYNPQAPKSLDCIGVNYYTHEYIAHQGYFFNFSRKKSQPHDIVTAKGRVIYPEGLYRAIQKAAELKVPIYISENGTHDYREKVRAEFIKKHLYVVHQALQDGFDIRGYTWWTFIDFAWDAQKQNDCYGIYQIDPRSHAITLREGMKPFVNFLTQRKK
jgi:beta-glucosidase